MKNERAGSPASVRFKFTWSTSIDECNGSDESCPMKDPRSKWEETVPDGELQIYYNMGMIQYVLPITIFGSMYCQGYNEFWPFCITYRHFQDVKIQNSVNVNSRLSPYSLPVN